MAQRRYGELKQETFHFKDDPESYVVVREATFGDDRARSQLWAHTETIYRDRTGETVYKASITPADVLELECFLTFVDSNLQGIDGKPLFEEGMNQAEFGKAFGVLPSAMTREWHLYVRRVNPDWGERERESGNEVG